MKISYETFEVSINDVIVMSFNVGFKHILFVRRSIWMKKFNEKIIERFNVIFD